jgi:hypothetical protein
MSLNPKQDPSLNENHQQKGGSQPMDEDGKGPQWYQLMGPKNDGDQCMHCSYSPT